MSRMRGQVQVSLVEPQIKDKFDRVVATELEVHMSNIHDVKMEEIDSEKNWHNFTRWGMEDRVWKKEMKFLKKYNI
jgi:hypothetical protein